MALTSQLLVSFIPDLFSPSVSRAATGARRRPEFIAMLTLPSLGRNFVTNRTIPGLEGFAKEREKQREWILQASDENEVVSSQATVVPTETKDVKQRRHELTAADISARVLLFEMGGYIVLGLLEFLFTMP